MGVLKAVLKLYKLRVPKLPFFCTCKLARRTWPKLKSHALTALAKHFKITYTAHNALDDAITCGKLVLMSAKKHGNANVAELLSAVGLEMGTLV
jgi:DNA polymerase-3 subunit epsilon